MGLVGAARPKRLLRAHRSRTTRMRRKRRGPTSKNRGPPPGGQRGRERELSPLSLARHWPTRKRASSENATFQPSVAVRRPERNRLTQASLRPRPSLQDLQCQMVTTVSQHVLAFCLFKYLPNTPFVVHPFWSSFAWDPPFLSARLLVIRSFPLYPITPKSKFDSCTFQAVDHPLKERAYKLSSP